MKFRIVTPLAIVVAVYGSDLHKTMLGVASLFGFGGARDLGRAADMILAAVTGLLCALVILRKRPVWILTSLPAMATFLLWAVLTVSLSWNSDAVSMENWLRFSFGNALLFLGALLCVQSTETFARIWTVWIITSVILALMAIYLFNIGITWTSARSEILPGGAIRTGYFCGVTVIYLGARMLFEKARMVAKLGKLVIVGLCMGGVLLSGSKAAMLLLVGMLGVLAFFKLFVDRRLQAMHLASIFLVVVATFGVVLSSIDSIRAAGGPTGYLGQLQQVDSYIDAGAGRIDLHRDYIELGTKTPVLGGGISASYSLYARTHSLTVALFVQAGLVGLFLYVAFLAGLLRKGYLAVRSVRMVPPILRSMIVATLLTVGYLAIKGEVTGDVPANRELWMFCGLLLATQRYAAMHLLQGSAAAKQRSRERAAGWRPPPLHPAGQVANRGLSPGAPHLR